MNSKYLLVSKISFKCESSDYYGIILSENKQIICAANVSSNMEIDGFSIIDKNKIKKISSKGKRSIFLSKVIKARSELIENPLEITQKTKLKKALSAIKGIVGIDFLYPKEDNGISYTFGYVDNISKKFVDVIFVGLEGQVEWEPLDRLKFVDIIKFEWNTGYIQAFELLHETSKSVLFKKWKSARGLDSQMVASGGI